MAVYRYWRGYHASSLFGGGRAFVAWSHPVELDRILVSSGWTSPTAITLESYYSLTGVLTRYLDETLQVINQGKDCEMGWFDFQEGLMIDEVYGGGFPISYTFTCSEGTKNPLIRITFMNEVHSRRIDSISIRHFQDNFREPITKYWMLEKIVILYHSKYEHKLSLLIQIVMGSRMKMRSSIIPIQIIEIPMMMDILIW